MTQQYQQAHHDYKRLQKQLDHEKKVPVCEWVYTFNRWSLFLDLFCLNGKGRSEDEGKHSLLFWLVLLLRFIRTDIKVQEWNADRHKIHRGIKHLLLKLHNIETLTMLVLRWWPLTPQDRGLLPDPTVTPHMLSAPSTRDVTYGQSIYERHLFLWGAIYSNSAVNSDILSTKDD